MRIVRWREWQAAPLTKIKAKRRENRVNESAPYAMPKVFVASSLDSRFRDFARVVGANAEAYFVRTLQYVALHDPFGGTLAVPRNAFGPVVLTREWDVVPRQRGCLVYDSLLSVGIAEETQGTLWNEANTGQNDRQPPHFQPPFGAPQRVPDGAPDGSPSSGSGSGSGIPPTPLGGSGREAPYKRERTLRVGIEAGCRAIHADPGASEALRREAASVFNGLRDGALTLAAATAFYSRSILTNRDYRIAALAAQKALKDKEPPSPAEGAA